MRQATHHADLDEQIERTDHAEDAEEAVRQAYPRAQAARQHSAALRLQAQSLVARSGAQRQRMQAVRARLRRDGSHTPHGS